MRLAALLRRRSAAPPAPQRAARPTFSELGAPGLRLSGSRVAEEYNPDLQGAKLYDEFDRMRRGSGQVRAIQSVISLPIRGLTYHVEPASDTPFDQRVADELHANLMSGMTCTWKSVVTHALLGVFMGYYLQEKVWEVRSEGTRLRKLAPRHPRNVKQWIWDSTGGVQGVIYLVKRPGEVVTTEVPISIESLLRWTWEEEGGNPEGMGLFRPMRTHWHIVQALWKIYNTGAENFFNPSVTLKEPANATESDRSAALGLLNRYFRGMVFPPGWEKPELMDGGARFANLLGYIQYHDTMMARTALAQWLQLGSGDTGSWALSDSHVGMFVASLNDIADWICEIISRYLLPQWVGYNYPGLTAIPELRHSSLQQLVQKGAYANALNQLVQGRLINPTADIEETICDLYDLPYAPADAADEAPEVEEDTIPQDDNAAAGGAAPRRARREGITPAGSRRHAERQRPRDEKHWDKTQARLSAAKDGFTRDMAALVKQQHAALKKQIEPIIESIRSSDDLSRGTEIAKLLDLKVPMTGRYTNLVIGWLRNFYTTALAAAAKAVGKPAPSAIPNAIRTWLATKGEIIANSHAAALLATVQLEAIEIVRKDLPTAKLLWNAEQSSRKRASLDLSDDLVAAGRELTDLINEALAEVELPDAES